MNRGFLGFLIAASLLCAVGCSIHRPAKRGSIVSHTVSRGETLALIASHYQVPLQELVVSNHLTNPNRLYIGQEIKIPIYADARLGAAVLRPRIDAPENLPTLTRANVRQIVGRLFWPVEGGVPGSRFGKRSGTFHEGLDIRAEQGEMVFAAHNGQVVYVGNDWSGYGNMVVLKGDGFYTVYAHNDRNLVAIGERIEQGEQIATVGMTGNASGPHLHFELRIDRQGGYKTAVDPAALAFVVRAPLVRSADARQVSPAQIQ